MRGEAEKPEETKDMGGWKALVYSAEQQARLGVNEMGEQLEKTLMPLTMPGVYFKLINHTNICPCF